MDWDGFISVCSRRHSLKVRAFCAMYTAKEDLSLFLNIVCN